MIVILIMKNHRIIQKPGGDFSESCQKIILKQVKWYPKIEQMVFRTKSDIIPNQAKHYPEPSQILFKFDEI